MENIVNSFNSLYKAYRKTRCGKRDNPTAMRYRMEAIERTADLSDRLQRREYTFGPYYPFKVYEPKERLVLAIDFEGKVVQHSLCDNVLEPAFSRRFIRDNYAGQIGKGTHDGLDSQYSPGASSGTTMRGRSAKAPTTASTVWPAPCATTFSAGRQQTRRPGGPPACHTGRWRSGTTPRAGC
jgi:hypothetical protein